MEKGIAVLGATGSVGTQCLSVCRQRGYKVVALTGHKNTKKLEAQAREFLPEVVVVSDKVGYADLQIRLADTGIRVECGADAIAALAGLPSVEIVFNSIVGIAGLRPTLAALEAGKNIALSNKEALIAGGKLVMDTAKKTGAEIFPVDSEHSAIWQCLQGSRQKDVRSIILTASGGPFYGKTREDLRNVTIQDALNHPNWAMGAKITIDSATLMNKGLEFIEAMWLFELTPEQIEVVVHRESVLHSAVDYWDGSVIGQLGVPDMRVAIQYALSHPKRPALAVERLSLTDYASLTFATPDFDTFTCLAVCIEAAKKGGLTPCIANGANEQAVELFLEGKIPFLQIGELVKAATEQVSAPTAITLYTIEQADQAARDFVLARTQ